MRINQQRLADQHGAGLNLTMLHLCRLLFVWRIVQFCILNRSDGEGWIPASEGKRKSEVRLSTKEIALCRLLQNPVLACTAGSSKQFVVPWGEATEQHSTVQSVPTCTLAPLRVLQWEDGHDGAMDKKQSEKVSLGSRRLSFVKNRFVSLQSSRVLPLLRCVTQTGTECEDGSLSSTVLSLPLQFFNVRDLIRCYHLSS